MTTTMAAEMHSLVVIGSGFGGAVVAARLVEAGARVTLLERGPWRDTNMIRAAGIAQRAPLPAGGHFLGHVLRDVSGAWLPGRGLSLNRDGLFDIHIGKQLSMICSSGVGGGSHVYSSMNVLPSPDYWDGYHDAISASAMVPHYHWILERLQSRVPDPQIVPNALAGDSSRPSWMITDAIPQPAMGYRFNAGRFTSNSFMGSRDNSKVTLDEALLLPLLGRGLTVRDRHEVLDIARLRRGFRLTVLDHATRCRRTLVAEKLVLAAGTLNTLRLLLGSRDCGSLAGMPALGRGISGNGDVPGYWPVHDVGRDYARGTPCHGRFALEGDNSQHMYTRFGLNGVEDIPMPALLRARLSSNLLLVAMGRDLANGLAHWRRGKLVLEYSVDANPVLGDIYRVYDRIGELSGKKVRFLRHMPVTVHPLGGARLGTTSREGVVDAQGQVHDIPGLFIADGSALPAAPGVPPSLSIAAWAGHVAQGLIKDLGQCRQ